MQYVQHTFTTREMSILLSAQAIVHRDIFPIRMIWSLFPISILVLMISVQRAFTNLWLSFQPPWTNTS